MAILLSVHPTLISCMPKYTLHCSAFCKFSGLLLRHYYLNNCTALILILFKHLLLQITDSLRKTVIVRNIFEPKQELHFEVGMRLLFILAAFLFQHSTYCQKLKTISFINDYSDVYHLSLIIYTPEGKGQTRVGELKPKQTKTYPFPVGTEIFVADWKQEAFAMKGNDVRSTGIKLTFILADSSEMVTVILSTLTRKKEDKPSLL
jgi:hypothetical protein